MNLMTITMMLSIIIIIFKSSAGIMGWRRQITYSTLIGFLITFIVFELTEQFHETSEIISVVKGEEDHDFSHYGKIYGEILIKVTTWLWPEFIISTLEGLAEEYSPEFS